MKSREVDGLGTFTFKDGLLIGKTFIYLFDNKYEIELNIKVREERFEESFPNLVTVCKKYLSSLELYMKQVKEVIIKYYEIEVKERAEEGFCDYIEISGIDEINKLSIIMKPEEIYFVSNKNRDKYEIKFGLIFSCDWHEDGFVILYDEECNIKELGTTDIIY